MSFGPQNNSGYGALFFAQGAGGGSTPDPLNVSTITTSTITANTIAVSTITAGNYYTVGSPVPAPYVYSGTVPTVVAGIGGVGVATVTLPFAYSTATSYTVIADYQDLAAATNPGPADVFGVWAYPNGVSTFNVVCNNTTASYTCGWITSGRLA